MNRAMYLVGLAVLLSVLPILMMLGWLIGPTDIYIWVGAMLFWTVFYICASFVEKRLERQRRV